MEDLKMSEKLHIPQGPVDEINRFLADPENPLMKNIHQLIEKHGGVDEINRKAAENGKLENLLKKLEEKNSPYLADLNWLIEQKNAGAFISIDNYRKKVLGDAAETTQFNDSCPVTLEISACQYFSFFMAQAKQSIENGELMPGRFIRVRFMKEQVEDDDILAVTAAMKIVGASWCETLDTKGTDGSNVHLGGPETITGYFGGIGQPNDYAMKWADELLHYYTNYGVKQVLNVNPGTVMVAYMLYKLGIDIEFKISVYMGNDNPYSVFWTLMAARLLAREDGTTPLIGFNFSNSVNNETIELSAYVRKFFGLEDNVRFEHHITETYKSIVVQPYNRRDELLEIAGHVPNISAKHEGGNPEIDSEREHPSDILEYFLAKADIEEKGMMPLLTRNYLDKHHALNDTAKGLTEKGLTFIAATELHK